MSDELPQEPVQQEQKPQRVDELDVIGNLLIRFIQKIVYKIKNR